MVNMEYNSDIYCTNGPESASVWLYKHPWITCQKLRNQKISQHINGPRCLRIKDEISCEVIHAFMHRKLGSNRACVYCARAAHAFSAAIQCRHCRNDMLTIQIPLLIQTQVNELFPKVNLWLVYFG